MKSEKQFANTLEDNIHKWGTMEKLISDWAQLAISAKVHVFLQALCIDDWQSEPHHQHQYFAENHWHVIKSYSSKILSTGASPSTWLLCLMWACFVLNHLAAAQLGYCTPMEALTGKTPDISLLLFYFWKPVYYVEPTEDVIHQGTKEK